MPHFEQKIQKMQFSVTAHLDLTFKFLRFQQSKRGCWIALFKMHWICQWAQYSSQIYANNILDDVLILILLQGAGSGQMVSSQNDKGKYISWVGSVHKAGKAGNSIAIVIIVTLVQKFYQKSLEQISSSSSRPDS